MTRNNRESSPPLPRNYVTILHLRERWFKAKQEEEAKAMQESGCEIGEMNRKSPPPLPPKYAAIPELREQWLMEKQQAKQEEEVKATEQKVGEDKELEKRERQENRYEIGETSKKPRNAVGRRGRFRPNRQGERFVAVGVKEHEPVESRIGEVAVDESQRKSDGSKKKKKKKSWPNRKAGAKEVGKGGTEQSLPEGESAEAVGQGDSGKEMEGTEINRNGVDMPVRGSNWEGEATVDGSGEIGQKMEVLSLGGERRGGRRSAGNVYGDHWKYKMGYAGVNRSKGSKLVWVRKGEPSDVNLA